MKTIELEIPDDIIEKLGYKAIKDLLTEQLTYQKFKILEEELQKSMLESDVNWSEEFERAKKEAYEEYKTLYNKNI
jgi:hypothetical protein